jgi:hypothetical protein
LSTKCASSTKVRQLDELRGRTAIVFAAPGITAGFLGKPALDHGLGGFGFFALIAFAACSFLLATG